jgi:hypothetical protein
MSKQMSALKHIEHIETIEGHIEKMIFEPPKEHIELCLRHNIAIVAKSFPM